VKTFDDVSPAQDAACGQHKTLTLKSVMPTGKLVEFFDGRPLRHVDSFEPGMHSGPGQRHPVFPADQAAHVSILGVQDAQGAPIPPPPDQSLGVGGHELAVQLEGLAP